MKYVRLVFPWVTALLLWRLQIPYVNPCGVLALIPVFYFSFARPAGYFVPFGAIVCLAVDFGMDTVMSCLFAYMAIVAVYNFQTRIDLSHQPRGGFTFFAGFIGLCAVISGCAAALNASNVWPLILSITAFVPAVILYIPFVRLNQRIYR